MNRGRKLSWCASLFFCVGLLSVGGCIEYTIPTCEGTPYKMPCVGPCPVVVKPAGKTSTNAKAPLAVVIQDEQGAVHCETIKP
jgi:hypothetical protein